MNQTDKLVASQLLVEMEKQSSLQPLVALNATPAALVLALAGGMRGSIPNDNAEAKTQAGGILRGVGRGALRGVGAIGGTMGGTRLAFGDTFSNAFNPNAVGAPKGLSGIGNKKLRIAAQIAALLGSTGGGVVLGDRLGKGMFGEFGHKGGTP